MSRRLAGALGLLLVALLPAGASYAGDRFMLRTSPTTVDQVCQTHRLKVVRRLGLPSLFLVEGPKVSAAALEAAVKADPRVEGFELDSKAKAPEVGAVLSLSQSSATLLTLDTSPLSFYGRTVWAGYAEQPAVGLIGADRARGDDGRTGGNSKVAVIDTGADPNHPLLKGWLIDGYDFTRDKGGGSEWADLTQSTAAILDQSTAAILDQATTVKLNQSTAAILDSETAAELAEQPPLPAAFGHGTMVAGLIRLVAPETKIIPLKAFRGDGSSMTSDIVRAIYYAVQKGANVINMSFSLAQPSRELERAILYAAGRGVVCVASAGNTGTEVVLYPASLPPVLGVASTTLEDSRSSFSSFGKPLVKVAAPGQDLITTYPGGHYAAVSGTSFSAALVSGGAAVLTSFNTSLDQAGVDGAFKSSSRFIAPELGYGRIDVYAALLLVAY